MKVSEKKRQLRKIGCWKVQDGTRHERWYSPITKKYFSVPRHDGKELAIGTAHSIDKDAGIE